jgi:amino acid ABC transporter substrate-binding protein, PAAT family (TC 3.A.1.3.-)
MMQDVALGRIDAMIQDKIAIVMAIEKSKLEVKIAGEPIEVMDNSFPFANNDSNKELITKVNKAIADMRADGTLAEISKKWLNADITNK